MGVETLYKSSIILKLRRQKDTIKMEPCTQVRRFKLPHFTVVYEEQVDTEGFIEVDKVVLEKEFEAERWHPGEHQRVNTSALLWPISFIL
ncbi:unnamed protein product [Heterobilharzia americana]|nr:unnamed protein product [Heterobilharzia americana]